MRFFLFNSEVVAKEVAWQLRAISIRKLVILPYTDPEAVKLAIALTGDKCIKCWKLFPFIATIGLFSLVSLRITEQFNHPDELKIFKEDEQTRIYICNSKYLNNLRVAINCDDNLKYF